MAVNYVMNRKNGKAYALTTNNVQSRDRVQVIGTGIRYPEHTQTALSSLVALNNADATTCYNAEKIIRAKQKRTDVDSVIVGLYRLLQDEVMSMGKVEHETINQENA